MITPPPALPRIRRKLRKPYILPRLGKLPSRRWTRRGALVVECGIISVRMKRLGMRRIWDCAALCVLALVCTGQANAAEANSGNGKLLLESNCSRCHATAAGTESPLKEAPNLWIVLRSYPQMRLEAELSEGIGSRHKDMPQIQFTSEEIADIQAYLFHEPGL